MSALARTAAFGIGMCLLGAAMSYLYYNTGAKAQRGAAAVVAGGRYNGPPCLDKKQGTGKQGRRAGKETASRSIISGGLHGCSRISQV